ncbi:hypothetical protein OIV83_000110 [Microbotryomycetes sp. JL201]|nr:hypothetical protein OIV83_000110 [Microbotryomycetes sp. JL201]
MHDLECDVLCVGAGPVGLLVAFQLSRFGCRPLVVEQLDKRDLGYYGRATTMWPRTLEMIDALGLLDGMLEQGVISRSGTNFKDGKAVSGGLVFGHRMDKHGDTRFKFALHLRQMYTEQSIVKELERMNHRVRFGHKLVRFEQDSTSVRKYIVGADGGKSLAVVHTNMPNERGLNSVQSPTHGLVLFAPIDAGTTRIGFFMPQHLADKCGNQGVTAEAAMAEAKKAVLPFTLDFERVDWVTLYGIGQRLASEFIRNRVILAGDSCHTHSSGSAQGLNTGTHDACNLGWKLAMDLKGFSKPELLQSYNDERRGSVQTVIDNDVIIASLVSGRLPAELAHRKENPRDLLDEWFSNRTAVEFTLGLGIKYPPKNVINQFDDGASLSCIVPGERGPDVELSRTGTCESVWLQRILINDCKFGIVVFTGRPLHTSNAIQTASEYIASAASLTDTFQQDVFRFVTVIAGYGTGAQEVLGSKPIGTPYFDTKELAHDVYGIDPKRGAVIVFRPDGYIGTVVAITEMHKLSEYFGRILEEQK